MNSAGINWRLDDEQQSFLDFVCQLIALRKSHPAFCRQNFFLGRRLKGADIKDILWLQPHGKEMTDEEWGEFDTPAVLACTWLAMPSMNLTAAAAASGTATILCSLMPTTKKSPSNSRLFSPRGHGKRYSTRAMPRQTMPRPACITAGSHTRSRVGLLPGCWPTMRISFGKEPATSPNTNNEEGGNHMKVVIMTREYPPHVYGGAGVHVEYLCPGIGPLGHRGGKMLR